MPSKPLRRRPLPTPDLTVRDVRELYRLVCRIYGIRRPPRLEVEDGSPGGSWGSHSPGHIIVNIARHRGRPLPYLLDTILHELAHEMAPNVTGHGEKWQRAAMRLGAVPTFKGLRL